LRKTVTQSSQSVYEKTNETCEQRNIRAGEKQVLDSFENLARFVSNESGAIDLLTRILFILSSILITFLIFKIFNN
jgi:hypothetical protein